MPPAPRSTAAPAASQLSRPPLERMLKIHAQLRRGARVNGTQLAEQIEVSRKTIVRDIAFMRDRLDLPIAFDPQLNTYRYTHQVEAFPTVNVTEGELLALLVAQRALEQYRGTPFHRQLSIAFEKLTSNLRDQISFSPSEEFHAVSFKNIGTSKTDLTLFNALSTAVQQQEEVQFEYRKPGSAATTHSAEPSSGEKGAEPASLVRHVRPYHLANRENLWYLIGYDLDRQALRTFALPRISALKRARRHFERPADFSPEQFFANALGVLGGAGDWQVRIRFSATVAERVSEREWHDSQELRALPDGTLELSLRLGALEEVEQWVLSWGAHAEVLGPPELRTKMQATAKKLVAIYK
ncbi:hypothetical protein AXK12_02970 [Cephaloticoccus capnophilus]|uniref:DNA-binding protein n=1 Tax=Cephaloticoccus capnophilus TaxID=1548208 RepID=A0A139SQC1_9BACT|nr:transcriptional regulator [Cephaloticoccus capnophilus]KXU36733.1 hypothetical protein AXK12_02970 [Cephaloticoccus capnophilus]